MNQFLTVAQLMKLMIKDLKEKETKNIPLFEEMLKNLRNEIQEIDDSREK